MASIRLKQYDDDTEFQNQILGVIISDFSAIPNPGSNQDPYQLRDSILDLSSPGVELLMSPLMQCANKNTREKGHNFEPRNPRVPGFRVPRVFSGKGFISFLKAVI